MKVVIGFLGAFLIINCHLAFAGPVGSKLDNDAEVINVPRRGGDSSDDDFNDFKGVINTEVGYPFFQPVPPPSIFNFGFGDSFEDFFHRLRNRLWSVAQAGGNKDDGSNDTSDETGFGFGIGNLPKNGTTSTVKVVDGHKIEVKESTYGDENNVFKVRVVNIRPVDSDEDTQTSINNADPNKQNPVTTAPPKSTIETFNNNNNNDDMDNDKREKVEKHSNENEVREFDDIDP